jgi:Tfp pilus assembly protein PilV
MIKTNHFQAGFSLVEVTLALGVVVFCLVTIMGLLAVGINTTHVSTVQTSAVNILTAVASDVEAAPNITPSYTPVQAKGTKAETSLIYGIKLPAGGAGALYATQALPAPAPTYTVIQSPIYIGENGQVVTTAASALYQLNFWINASTATQQETFVRLIISWPAAAAYTSAQGNVESVLAINRT